MGKNKGLLKKLNASWKSQPALWALGLIFTTAFVDHAFDWAFSSVSEKDEVFIEMAKRLTGQADEATVAKRASDCLSHKQVEVGICDKGRLECVDKRKHDSFRFVQVKYSRTRSEN